MRLSGPTSSKDKFTSRTELHLSNTTGLRVGGFKEHPHLIWGIVVSIYVIIVQGETVRSRAAVIRVTDNAVDYLLTNLALRVPIPFRYAAKAPAIRGPFEEDMMPNKLLICRVEEGEHGVGWWYGYGLEARGGEDFSFLSFFGVEDPT